MANQIIKGIKINGTAYDGNISNDNFVSYLTTPNGKNLILATTNEGELYTYKPEDIPEPIEDTPIAGKCFIEKFYINEIYCGGLESNEHTLNYCSHNFVELANLTSTDINLKGISLQYAINGSDWAVLPLKGYIKAGSTFLIRGAQCSMLNSPTTKIHVDKYDMEWYNDDGTLKKFENVTSAKFYLTFNLNKYSGNSPYNPTEKKPEDNALGYIDLVGIKGVGDPGGYEIAPYSANGGLKGSRLFKKYYAMDPVSQATKAINARNNSNDINYVDLTKNDGDLIPSLEAYTPRASSENKNIFYNKTDLSLNKPSMITCTFGIQATDNGSGATRCFNWLTRNLDNNYIWIKKKSDTSWGTPHETFYSGDTRTIYTNDIYNRKMVEYTNNRVIIANKFIISGLTADTYCYVAGSKNEDGTPNLSCCTEEKEFKVRTNEEVNNGFSFVQTSDQQGFNWEEYRVWEATAKIIEKEKEKYGVPEFMINTGDMTQNGNRMGEWLDYFNGKGDFLDNMEEMATIGNNDLSLNVLYKLGDGGDLSKLWLENITFFYTFESDENNIPIFHGYDVTKNYYIPSLYSFNYGKVHFMCINSEIKANAEQNVNGYNFGQGNYGVFYPQIKEWCEKDVELNSGITNLTIGYCHEMPFTIITSSFIQNPSEGKYKTLNRGGSSANTNTPLDLTYWLSEFFQTHNIPLVLGGHKHTQSTSMPIMENVVYENDTRKVKSMYPIIVVDENLLYNYFESATTLENATVKETNDDGKTWIEYQNKYPNTWIENGEVKDSYLSLAHLCTFKWKNEIEEGKTPVVYAMSQSSGYKHTSNKELPATTIPWLRNYFPEAGTSKANEHQKFPFYTIWTIKDGTITGNVRKGYGIFNGSGKFDINTEWQYVKKGKCSFDGDICTKNTDLFSVNGIKSMDDSAAKDSTEKIIINY